MLPPPYLLPVQGFLIVTVETSLVGYRAGGATSLGINNIGDLPVGKNLHDHVSGSLFLKLRNLEKGLAIGSPLFNKSEYFTSTAVDWISTITIPNDLISAAAADGTGLDELFDPGPRAHIEFLTVYAPIAGGGTEYRLPFDGTHISTPTLLLLPTSRGQVTLASMNATDDPIIDPGYLSTEVDRVLLREVYVRRYEQWEPHKGRAWLEGEALHRVFRNSQILSKCRHSSHGTIVDTECNVKVIRRLRVSDISILPLPIASHYQTAMYVIAEATAAMILEDEVPRA
ncbi:uncharacterized protein BDR25DRAFT_314668 [Lindgomyces ingoldianus]|uniref:Uncharacterized protein n=1 Tax=Lindgomyces ingoldianus TaxID=673940 RepID=A0ACB6QUE1_9PLEO|nr:uncharacterized protein BDR25DRAFT_314668 [Lindgomyces ingoldianus]KAF2470477.1 hypothetical protein BDR25DRAFT_314668 [Lindgomyces ingoldianus]